MIIDVHTHIFRDDIAERAVEQLSAAGSIPAYTNGTLGQLIASMDRASIDASVIAPVSTKPSQVRSINDFSAQCAGERIIPFGTLHPDFGDIDAEVDRMKAMGILGIKLHPEYQVFYPDDERVFGIYEALARDDLVLLFHAGIDVEIPTLHATPERLARVHEAFPDLVLILAHLGSYKLWDDVERHLVGKNVYFDTSYIFGDIDLDQFRRIVADHGPERILFGTDSPWTDQAVEVGRLRDSGLADDIVEKILGANAAHLLGR